MEAREKLNPTQQKMVEVTLSCKRVVDGVAIARELKAWVYPLYYLDFETVAPAIPRYMGTKPNQQVPFQFSCHIQAKPGGPLVHAEYLHDSVSDPRLPLAKALVGCIGKKGSVVAYNKGFERSCFKAPARLFPKYEKALLDIASRLARFTKSLCARLCVLGNR